MRIEDLLTEDQTYRIIGLQHYIEHQQASCGIAWLDLEDSRVLTQEDHQTARVIFPDWGDDARGGLLILFGKVYRLEEIFIEEQNR
jgi:hypothetical protein